jgi:ABC-type transport system involved in multi-copper enzyme maturation permease subunit
MDLVDWMIVMVAIVWSVVGFHLAVKAFRRKPIEKDDHAS